MRSGKKKNLYNFIESGFASNIKGDKKQEKVSLIETVHLPEAKRGTNHLGIRSQLRAMRTLLYTFGLGKGEEGGEKGR